MKKSIVLFAVSALAASMIPFSASAAENTADIHVVLTLDEKVLDKDITVKDVDNDGKLTVYDAFYEAHEQFYPGGAAAGYSEEDGFIWGRHCSGEYSLINPDEYPLEDRPYNERVEIRSGDVFDWSANYICPEGYSFESEYLRQFDANAIPCGTELDIRVYHLIPTQRDPEYVEGIEILVDGQKTGVKSGADGKAVLKLTEEGVHRISTDAPKVEGSPYNDLYVQIKVLPAETEAPATEAAIPETTAAETVSTEAVKAETVNTEAAKTETVSTEATKAETANTETTKAETISTTAAKAAEKAAATQNTVNKKPANAPATQTQASVKTNGVQTGETDAGLIAALTALGLSAAAFMIITVARRKF